ncbi:hypothetical protein FFLO_01585 [Filobasidium floriforme]|uniref:tRNA-splicing endonuclease subunit Sen34 n=1 Tax=Filobasidium floriforme TaxID=5210 RepID=A0A8K0NUT2_9TREE|nr:uncharacterized protein HD553DRAFT_300642 [Filobasidium floriforme]KAG7563027.1 hypothetical protein FFLO_01585 [Filobasidium floriforme]KAH8079237.1 hypothetical protein HD553DRAFT_300642 [Filobasidium floriforme]
MSTIPLYVSGKKAFCWDAQHAATLRVQHRICGLTTGTLPGVSQQNVFLGLPLVMMPEEVVLLVQEGVCHLVHTPHAFQAPSRSQVVEQDEARQEYVHNLRVSMADALEEKKKAFSHKIQSVKRDEVKRQREEKRLNKGKGKEREGGEVDAELDVFIVDSPAQAASTASEEVPRETGSKHKDVTSTPYFLTVPAHPDVTPSPQSWFEPRPGESSFTDLDSARAAGVWTYPDDLVETSRCATFRKLWEAGMYMGQGIKFGGEFLGYPGDPLRYHSHFVTTTMTHPERVIRPLELVAFGRLGTATKKAHLLCCFDEDGEKGRVDCYSLEWGNFG